MSGALSLWHILVVVFLVLVFFGRGRVSDLMADIAKGVRQFRKGVQDGDPPGDDEPGRREKDL